MFQATYTVHSVQRTAVEQEVTLGDGREVTAMVEGLVVELVETGGENTIMRRFIPVDMDKALIKFSPEAIITITFE